MEPRFQLLPVMLDEEAHALFNGAAYEVIQNFHVAIRSIRTANGLLDEIEQPLARFAEYRDDVASRVMRAYDVINPIVSAGAILMPLGDLEVPLCGSEERRRVTVFVAPPTDKRNRSEWREESNLVVLYLPEYEVDAITTDEELIYDPVANSLLRECFYLHGRHGRLDIPYGAAQLAKPERIAFEKIARSPEEFEAEGCVIGSAIELVKRFAPVEMMRLRQWIGRIEKAGDDRGIQRPSSLYHSWGHVAAWLSDSALRPVFIERIKNALSS